MSHVGPSGTESTYRLLEIHQSGIQTSRDRGKCNEVEVTTSCDLISNIDVLLNGSLLSGISSAVFISNINRQEDCSVVCREGAAATIERFLVV